MVPWLGRCSRKLVRVARVRWGASRVAQALWRIRFRRGWPGAGRRAAGWRTLWLDHERSETLDRIAELRRARRGWRYRLADSWRRARSCVGQGRRLDSID